MTQKVQKYLKVGHVSDAFGLKGELYIHLRAHKAEWLKKLKELRLVRPLTNEPRGSLAPQIITYEVQTKRAHKNGFVVKPQGIDDRTEAERLIGYEVEIPTSYLKSQLGETPYLYEVLGFQVRDEKVGSLGNVLAFSSNGAQDLLVLKYNEEEVLIPFVSAFIRNIDYENRCIDMTLPEGLVEPEGLASSKKSVPTSEESASSEKSSSPEESASSEKSSSSGGTADPEDSVE